MKLLPCNKYAGAGSNHDIGPHDQYPSMGNNYGPLSLVYEKKINKNSGAPANVELLT